MARSPLVVALGHREVRLLVCAQAFSLVGTGSTPLVLSFALLSRHADPATIGVVLGATGLAFALSLLPAGVIADRVARRGLAAGADWGRALSMLAAAGCIAFVHGDLLFPLAACGATWGVSRAFFTPTITGLVPEIVPEELLAGTNALRSIAISAGLTVGPALGGVIVATLGPSIGALGAVAAYLTSGAVLLRLPRARARLAAASRHPLADLFAGFAEVRRRAWCSVIIASSGAMNLLCFGPLLVLGPIVAERHLGGAAAWGGIAAAEGVGGILGALGAGHLHPARPLVVALALAPLGAFVYLALALVAPFPLIAAASSLSGGVFGVFEVLWETTLQRSVAREALSRVSSLDWLGSTATNPLGQGLAGITAGAFSVEDVLLVGTVAMLLIPLLGLGSRSVRAAQKEHGGRPARDETPPLPDAS